MGVGTQRYYLTPKGLLTVGKLPNRWGLLEANEDGGVLVIRGSDWFRANHKDEVKMLFSLIRRTGIQPGKHPTIRALASPNSKKPRATVTICDPDIPSDA